VGSGLVCLGQASYDVQYNLGPLYQNGQGVPQDMAQARAWIQKAAVGYDNAYKWLAIN
jgi:TPR repeat protein